MSRRRRRPQRFIYKPETEGQGYTPEHDLAKVRAAHRKLGLALLGFRSAYPAIFDFLHQQLEKTLTGELEKLVTHLTEKMGENAHDHVMVMTVCRSS